MKKSTLSTRVVTILLAIVLTVNPAWITQNDFMLEEVTEAVSAGNENSVIVAKAASTKKQKIAAYNKKAKKAYKKFMKGYFEKGKSFTYDKRKYNWPYKFSEYGGAPYLIYDINNDGKKELILSGVDSDGSSFLFIYYKGKVKCIGRGGHYGYYWGHKKGKLIGNNYKTYLDGIEVEDGYMTEYYKIKNGKLKIVAKSFDNSMFANKKSQYVKRYWIGNKKVTKKKFNQFVKKNTGSTNPKKIECYDKFVTYK